MNAKRNFHIFFVALIATVAGCHSDKFDHSPQAGEFVAENLNAQDKKLAWDFPVKPGTDAWKRFQSNEEMVKACQIPEEKLLSLSTEDLADICLQYPLLYDVFAFNDLNDGLNKLFNDFNGIRELYKRDNLSVVLIKRYNEELQSFSLLNENRTEANKGYFIISVSAMEVLLSRLSEQDNESNRKEILQSLVTGYEDKLKYQEYFKGFGFQTNFYSRGRVISKMDKSFVGQLSQTNRNAALGSGMVDEESIKLINEMSYRLIK